MFCPHHHIITTTLSLFPRARNSRTEKRSALYHCSSRVYEAKMKCSINNNNNKNIVPDEAIRDSSTLDSFPRNLSFVSDQHLSTGTNNDLRATTKSQDAPKRQDMCTPPREDSRTERLPSACSTINELIARTGEGAKSSPRQVASRGQSYGQDRLPSESYFGTLPLKDSPSKRPIKNKEVSFLKYADELLRSLDDETDDEDYEDYLMPQ